MTTCYGRRPLMEDYCFLYVIGYLKRRSDYCHPVAIFRFYSAPLIKTGMKRILDVLMSVLLIKISRLRYLQQQDHVKLHLGQTLSQMIILG